MGHILSAATTSKHLIKSTRGIVISIAYYIADLSSKGVYLETIYLIGGKKPGKVTKLKTFSRGSVTNFIRGD